MCLSVKTPDIPSPAAPPTRRKGGAVAQLFQRRRQNATGAFGNIFTSPTGTLGGATTSATRLGGGGSAGA